MLDEKKTPTGDAGALSHVTQLRRPYLNSKSLRVCTKLPACNL